MPDQLAILRLAALLIFIGLVAVGLWLLDVPWWVVPPVMAVALLIAWTIEWLAWRGSLATTVMRETAAPPALPPAPVEEPAPAEAFVTLAPPEAAPLSELEAREEPPAETESPEDALEQEPEARVPPSPPEPEREPESAPPTPEPPEEPPAAAPAPEEQARAQAAARRPRRLRLRPVPAPREARQQEPEPEPRGAAPGAASVVDFRPRAIEPRQWNLWDLERIAREEAREHPERRDEWAYLFLHLREYAKADGSLPAEFDGLVRESFAGLLERPRGA